MRKFLFIFVTVLAVALVADACGNRKHGGRKCDGRRGQKTPMGRI